MKRASVIYRGDISSRAGLVSYRADRSVWYIGRHPEASFFNVDQLCLLIKEEDECIFYEVPVPSELHEREINLCADECV